MGAGSDNVFPKLITAVQSTDIAAPSDGSWKIYSKPGGIYARSSNSVVGPFAASGSVSLTTVQSILTSGDITLTQNTYTDIVSVSLVAGTWLILGQANLTSTSGAQDVSAALYNSTDTAYLSNGSMSMAATGYDETIQLHALLTIAGTKTIKLQGTGSGAGGAKALRVTVTNSTGQHACQLTAIKIA